jgi:hypothetical protein
MPKAIHQRKQKSRRAVIQCRNPNSIPVVNRPTYQPESTTTNRQQEARGNVDKRQGRRGLGCPRMLPSVVLESKDDWIGRLRKTKAFYRQFEDGIGPDNSAVGEEEKKIEDNIAEEVEIGLPIDAASSETWRSSQIRLCPFCSSLGCFSRGVRLFCV